MFVGKDKANCREWKGEKGERVKGERVKVRKVREFVKLMSSFVSS